VNRRRLLWAVVALVALAAAALLPRAVRRDEAARPRPAAAAAAVPAAPEPDPSAWRGGGEPSPVAPGVLARVAPRRPPAPPPAPAPACPGPAFGCGSGVTGPAACSPERGPGGARACDNEEDGVEAIEIDWSDGDDP
jgi:hypothetical protein